MPEWRGGSNVATTMDAAALDAAAVEAAARADSEVAVQRECASRGSSRMGRSAAAVFDAV